MDLPGLLITGSDTNVGKTYVTSMIARDLVKAGLKVGAYKPVCSGSGRDSGGQPTWRDVEELAAAIGGGYLPENICPQRFIAPLAPPVAARLEGKQIDSRLLRTAAQWWRGRVDLLLVEGVGGLLCPLTDDETLADLAVDLGFPLIIVVRLGLGTVNHTLMTVEVAENRGLHIAGIVLNQATAQLDESGATNPDQIASRCDVPILGVIKHGQSGGLLQNGRRIRIDWCRLLES